jgi:flagellar biosynthetic protein FlhB
MSRQELKEEVKATEGDPQVRGRIRAIQRETARRRMMAEVPKATVVVTNPTHVAVALSYPRRGDGEPVHAAPRVVAKGLGEIAERIKAVAREAGVLCYEDVPLARALHADVDLGAEIPPALYKAVAEVLNYVYRVRGAAGAA